MLNGWISWHAMTLPLWILSLMKLYALRYGNGHIYVLRYLIYYRPVVRQPWSRAEGLDRRILLQGCLVYGIVSVEALSVTIWLPCWLLLDLRSQRKLWRWWHLPLWNCFGLACFEFLRLQLRFGIRVTQSSPKLADRRGSARSEGLLREHLYLPAACSRHLHLLLRWGHTKPLLSHRRLHLLLVLALHDLHVERSVWLRLLIEQLALDMSLLGKEVSRWRIKVHLACLIITQIVLRPSYTHEVPLLLIHTFVKTQFINILITSTH